MVIIILMKSGDFQKTLRPINIPTLFPVCLIDLNEKFLSVVLTIYKKTKDATAHFTSGILPQRVVYAGETFACLMNQSFFGR